MRKCGEAPDGRNDEKSNDTQNDLLRNQPSIVGPDGGVCNGICREVHFGYEPTTKADFSVNHSEQAKAVGRVFKLGISLSAKQIARVLARDRRSSPSGTVRWTARKAPSIRNNVTYAGRIHFEER
jgi:hypothetical protein